MFTLLYSYNMTGVALRSRMQQEVIDRNEILLEDVDVFNEKLMDWLLWYDTKRFHWILNLATPVNYLINNGLLSNMRRTNTKPLFL